jgi:general L-amino acid transport system substrate-binding protein
LASQLDGATMGIQSGTIGELNIADFFRKRRHKFTPVAIA